MKKNMIAVCDSDTDYACNFTEYLNNKKKLPFRAEAFTDVEKFYSSVGSQPPPMLLIAQKDVDERIQQIKEENVVVLSDEKEEPKSPYKCIYKYQSAESVIKEVMEYYTEKTQVPFCSDARQGMKIVGIYSPSEICANCLFALAAAQILGEEKRVLYISMEDFAGLEQLFLREYEKNLTDFFFALRCGKENLWEELGEEKRVLYISMEDFAGLEQLFLREYEKNLTDFFFALRCGKENLWEEVEGMIQQQGDMDYLPPVESPEDIKSIPFVHWSRLFEAVKKSGRYHVLILNISSAVDELFSVLNLCSEIYVPVKGGFIADCKLSQFHTLMENWGVIEKERIRIVSHVLILNISSAVDELFSVLNLCSEIYVPVKGGFIADCKLSQFHTLMENWGVIEKERIRIVSLSGESMEGINTVQELKMGPWGNFVRKVLENYERRKQ